VTYFNAGQIFDLRDPLDPSIARYYIPHDPATRLGPLPKMLVTKVEDVVADRRGTHSHLKENSVVSILHRLPIAS
jgi:hypothetical protein